MQEAVKDIRMAIKQYIEAAEGESVGELTKLIATLQHMNNPDAAQAFSRVMLKIEAYGPVEGKKEFLAQVNKALL
ncbi:MAG TPA: hypothetical protein VGV92_08115 [Gammaproteobacteria bacterium]|nr:hypothetical protein [Gammaproteobacteria bacterium]